MRVAILVGVLMAVGCGKRPAEPTGDDTTPPRAAAQPAYTLSIAEPKAGRWRYTEKVRATTTVSTGGMTDTDTRGEDTAFTETYQEPAAGSERITRAYAVASETTGGQTKHRPYAGKVVTIEKTGDLYTFSIDGQKLSQTDAEPIARDFTAGRSLTWAERLPDQPVKEGAEWSVKKEALRSFARGRALDVDVDQSSITGRLIKVYDEGGRRWGKLEYKGLMVSGKTAGKDGPGVAHQLLTVESPIDGKPGAFRSNQRATADWEPRIGGKAATASIEMVTDRSRLPAD